MRHLPLAAALAALLPLAALSAPMAPGKSISFDPPAQTKKSSARATYIVSFAETPLAAYTGGQTKSAGGVTLTPTAPWLEGKRKLDVTTKASREYASFLRAHHDSFLAEAAHRIGRELTPRFRYTVVGNGLSVELTEAEAEALRAVPGVVSVRRDRVYHATTDASAAWIGADKIWNGLVPGFTANKGEGIVIGVIDGGINYAHPSFSQTPTDGYTYTNPRGRVLGLCSTTIPDHCNNKLIGIYDFSADPGPTVLGNDDDGHGSHVASTAAGNPVTASVTGTSFTTPISGIAPHANIVAYKVLAGESGSTSAILAGIEAAVSDQVDVINMSLGGGHDDPWGGLRSNQTDDFGVALLNARFAGVVSVVAAGNEGPGTSSATDPSTLPWVIAAAAATHNRSFENRVDNVTGTGITTPRSFAGLGVTDGLPQAKIVHASQFGFPLCGAGPSEDTPTGASNPFPVGTFHGEIVICDRGQYGRVEKGFNVKRGGAGGMILANTAATGESIVADAHVLPAVHVGVTAGDQLRALVAAATSANGQITGAISGLQRKLDNSKGDVLASFSGRGPAIPIGGFLKPNITAPGVAVLAAVNTPNGFDIYDGTSMASPNVAGSAALVSALHPTWTPAQVESALLTTGVDGVRDDRLATATPLDAGAGRVDPSTAARAALFFNMTRAQFVAADPEKNGHPQAMNMPYLVDERCVEHCSFTRTVTDMAGGGAWRVEYRGPAAGHVTITPSSFQLAANATQSIQFDVDVTDPSLVANWLFGQIAFVNTSGGNVPEQRLPLAAFAYAGNVPTEISVATSSNGGAGNAQLNGLLALPRIEVRGRALVQSVPGLDPLPKNPAPDNIFNTVGTAHRTFTVPANTDPTVRSALLYAHASSPTANDIDLFMFSDEDGDGKFSTGDKFVCLSASESADESCSMEVAALPFDRQYLVYVNNFASGPTGTDAVQLVAGGANIGSAGTRLVPTGPGHSARQESVNLRFAINEPRMQAGETWLGFVDVGTSSQTPNGVGRFPVVFTTTNETGVAAQMLSAAPVASGPNDSLSLTLAPGAAHERIAIDIPPGATSLTVDSAGTGEVDLYLAKGAALDATSSAIAPAPARTSAQGTSIHPGASETITLTSTGTPALTPGRWYITPVNSGSTAAAVTVHATVVYGSAAPTTRLNAYFNPARSGHGIFLSEGGSTRVLVWYTYLPDGSPAWYLAQGTKPAAGAGVWTAPLYRFSWDGAHNFGTIVGEVTLTTTAANQLNFSWLVDGQFGSEPMVELAAPTCPSVGGTPTDFSGTWYAPALDGYGFSVLTRSNFELEVSYLYDGQGNPRWLLGQNTPFGSGTFSLLQYTGFCPSCAFQEVQSRAAGTLNRTLTNARAGMANVNGTFLAPATGVWQTNHSTTKLTDDLTCN